MSDDDSSDWADRLRTPPLEVIRAWTEADADPSATPPTEEPLAVWTWLGSVLPDAVSIDTHGGDTVIHLGVLWLHLRPVPHPDLEDAGWPPGALLVLGGPGLAAVTLATDEGPGWVISRGDDPELPTLVAAAPTVATLHRELAHRIWHRCVDLLEEAGDEPVDPLAAAVAVHEDLVGALARGWREQLFWVPAITAGRREWSADLDGVPTGSWLDVGELPVPYRLEANGSRLIARAATAAAATPRPAGIPARESPDPAGAAQPTSGR